jgi:predicted transposase YbfD/YdcC
MTELDPASIVVSFLDLTDHRADINKRHKLIDIVTISICAVLCGADTWDEIEEFGQARVEWLRSFLELPHGIPSHDTFNRVFCLLCPDEFRRCFLRWIRTVLPAFPDDVVAIDGKTLRRSRGASDQPPIHMVTAWANAHRMVLGQIKTEEKSNEITAIPQLLRALDLTGSTVTIDALGCQKAIADQLINQGADYVLSVKGNQGTLLEDIDLFFREIRQHCPENIHPTRCQTTDGDHGRIEIRRYCAVEDIDWLTQRHPWAGLRSIAMVESERQLAAKATTEIRYFISSLPSDATRLAQAIRGHWGIENSLHWVLDVAFREDLSRIRKDHAPENFAILRHIALNLIRSDKSTKGSVRTKRLRAGWDLGYLATLLRVATR